jgi:hypothetical protein
MKSKVIGFIMLVGLIGWAVPAQADGLLWEDQFNDAWPDPGWDLEWLFQGEDYGPGYLTGPDETGNGQALFSTGATQIARSHYTISDGPKTIEAMVRFPNMGNYSRVTWFRDPGENPGGPNNKPPRVEMYTYGPVPPDVLMQVYILDTKGESMSGFNDINALADWTQWNVFDLVISEHCQRVYVNGVLAVEKRFDCSDETVKADVEANPLPDEPLPVEIPILYRGGIGGSTIYSKRWYADYYQVYDGEYIMGKRAPKISGLVTLQGCTNNSEQITFELRLPGTTPAVAFNDEDLSKDGTQVTTSNTGAYTLEGVPPATYDLTAKGSKWLRKKVTNVAAVPGENTVVDFLNLKGGDANDTNSVNILDLNILKGSYGKSSTQPGYDARADFNKTDSVNILDLNILKSNYGKSGE